MNHIYLELLTLGKFIFIGALILDLQSCAHFPKPEAN